jgi:lipopolysaccharide export system permease protein
MLLFDRYLLKRFFRTLLVCFTSAAGLFVVIDVFANLEEFITLGERHGGMLRVLVEYYGPRVALVFDRMCAFVVLLAAMFTITWLNRSHELTALFAAGVSPRRIARPLVGAAVVVIAIAAVNRELLIPQHRDRLTRNAQDWLGSRARAIFPRRDNRTDLLLNGEASYPGERKISRPRFSFVQPMAQFGRHVTAENAYYQPATAERPGGYLLEDVIEPEGVADLPSLAIGGEPTVLTPRDSPWLKSNQCFVVSDVDFEQLAGGAGWRQFSSTSQLWVGLRNSSLDYGADVRVEVHSRLVRPLLDLSLLFLGLPLAFLADHRNVFLAAGKGMLLALAFLLVVLVCQGLGAAYWIRPALAAWAPLLIFIPLAVYLNEPLGRSSHSLVRHG